jgi:hypothetical protein
MELAKSHRFGLSGLNLAFEGLLLEVNLCILTEGTRSNPRQSGFQIRNTLSHTEGMSAMFCRKSKVSRVSKQRLQWTDGREACITTQVEVRSQRGHAGYQPKVTASMRHAAMPPWTTKSGVLM